MTRPYLLCAALLAASMASTSVQAAEGVGEKIGEKIDQGLNTLGNELRQGWDRARDAINQLGVQGRVYSRVHWDKQLTSAAIDIDTESDGVVILRGSVPDLAAKSRAVSLAQDTVGVERVVDRLAVASEAR